MKKISIVTIVYNNKQGLENTIKSVISQTYEDKEYLVIDGGSTDGSVDVINEYSDKIDYWVSEKDKGIYDAMNKGLKAATGEWVIFMNSSDVFVDEHVLSNIFSREYDESISFIFSDYYEDRGDHSDYCTSDATIGKFMHQSIIYKRNLHEQYGYYLVTKPLIISDFLFLASVPISSMYKTDVVISKIIAGGISQQGMWALFQMVCGQHIFYRKPIPSVICQLCKYYIIEKTPKGIKNLIKIIRK